MLTELNHELHQVCFIRVWIPKPLEGLGIPVVVAGDTLAGTAFLDESLEALYLCARRDSNSRPIAPEAIALSN